ncbi:MAG: prepilin peptidase [Alphaproteobacteria bacterium]|nr:prepilin peptidase [Alphaproteobacteria bacterium]
MSQALHILDQVSVVAFAAIALMAALGDWSRFIIPNRLSLAVVGVWAFHALLLVLQGQSPLIILWSILIALAVFLVGFGLFAARLLGGGDVKFLAAATLWAAPDYVIPFIVIVTVSGALLGLAFLIPGLGHSPQEIAPADGAPATDEAKSTVVTAGRLGRKMPYGLAIAVGCVAVSLHLLNGLWTGG